MDGQGNFYLFFVSFEACLCSSIDHNFPDEQVILTSSLEDEVHWEAIKWFNAFIQYWMAGLVIAGFLLSMGNKPKA